MAGIIVGSVITVMFVIFGILLRMGKCAWIIAGYNTMPKEEKAKYNEKVLCRGMGNGMFVFAFCCLLVTIGEILEVDWLAKAAGGLIIVTAIVMVVWGNLSRKVKK